MHKALIASAPKGNCLAGKAGGRQEEAGLLKSWGSLPPANMFSRPEIKNPEAGAILHNQSGPNIFSKLPL